MNSGSIAVHGNSLATLETRILAAEDKGDAVTIDIGALTTTVESHSGRIDDLEEKKVGLCCADFDIVKTGTEENAAAIAERAATLEAFGDACEASWGIDDVQISVLCTAFINNNEVDVLADVPTRLSLPLTGGVEVFVPANQLIMEDIAPSYRPGKGFAYDADMFDGGAEGEGADFNYIEFALYATVPGVLIEDPTIVFPNTYHRNPGATVFFVEYDRDNTTHWTSRIIGEGLVSEDGAEIIATVYEGALTLGTLERNPETWAEAFPGSTPFYTVIPD